MVGTDRPNKLGQCPGSRKTRKLASTSTQVGGNAVNQALADTVLRDTLCAMDSPLTYPDHPRGDNLAEFFLKMIGACLKKALSVLLVWLVDALP